MFKPANQIEACGRSYTVYTIVNLYFIFIKHLATPNIIIMCLWVCAFNSPQIQMRCSLQMLVILQRVQVIMSKVNDTVMSLINKGLELQSFLSMKMILKHSVWEIFWGLLFVIIKVSFRPVKAASEKKYINSSWGKKLVKLHTCVKTLPAAVRWPEGDIWDWVSFHMRSSEEMRSVENRLTGVSQRCVWCTVTMHKHMWWTIFAFVGFLHSHNIWILQ